MERMLSVVSEKFVSEKSNVLHFFGISMEPLQGDCFTLVHIDVAVAHDFLFSFSCAVTRHLYSQVRTMKSTSISKR